MFHNKFKQNDPVAEAIAQIAEADYKAKMEALKGAQHKIDKNKNNKIDAHDFAILRGDKKAVKEEEQLDELSKKTLGSYIKKSSDDFPQHQAKADAITSKANPHKPLPADAEKSLNKVWNRKVGIYRATDKLTKEEEQVEEGWDDMMKAAKERRGPQPSGGSGKKAGSRYGGSNQKSGAEDKKVNERLEPSVKSHDGLKGPAPGVSPNKMRSNKVKFVPEESINEGLNDDDHYIYHPDTKKVVKRIPASSAKVPFGTSAADHPSIKPHLDQANSQHGPGHKVAKGMKLKDIIGESVEQIDELSKKTLGDYVKKASHDVAHKGALTRKHAMDSDAAKEKQDYVGARKSMEKSDKTFAKSWKRREGMAKAVDRLTKENVEQVNERELTKGETKEKERIVKGMKKSFAGFRARYGDRAKSVMYATATKAAKDD